MLVDVTKIGFQNPSSNVIPQEGPKAVPFLLDFSGAITEYDFDFTIPIDTKKITQINTLYVDASLASSNVTIVIASTNQKIVVHSGTQGYYPVLAPNPPRFTITSAASNAVVPIFFINVPLSGVVWTV